MKQLHADAAKAVGDWHIEQTLQAISLAQSHLKKPGESAKIMLTVAE